MSGSTYASRGVSECNESWMSMIGLAARPATDVDPDVVDARDQIGGQRGDDAGGLGLESIGPRRVGIDDVEVATAPRRLAGLRPGR